MNFKSEPQRYELISEKPRFSGGVALKLLKINLIYGWKALLVLLGGCTDPRKISC